MRNAALLMVALAVACSANHVVVAALDDAGGGNTGAMLGGAGNSSLSAGAGAGGSAISSGGARVEQDAGIVLTSGGSTVDVRIDGDAGASSVVICACASEPAPFCGSDGMTYPTSCDDGGTCLPPAVACWHACPCLEGESPDIEPAFWFAPDCAPATGCDGGFTCVTLSNVTSSVLTLCVPDEN